MPTTKTGGKLFEGLMSLKLFYITNEIDIAKIAQAAGCDRIFVDLEYIGKSDRQGGLDTVQSHHTVEDIQKLRPVVNAAELLVRCNPIHDATEKYPSSEDEIDSIVATGADIIMLPYFKSVAEVKRFIAAIHGRSRAMLLLETPEAVEQIDDILAVSGIDEVFIGLNDLSLAYGMRFMFQLLDDGTIERLALKIRQKGLPFGFGGIAAIGTGTLPAEAILKEHYRLGSSMVILSRSFCNTQRIADLDVIREKFMTGLRTLRAFEEGITVHSNYFSQNRQFVSRCVAEIVNKIHK